MGASSSRSKKGEITEADRAVLTLKTQRRKLANEQKRLEVLVAREIQVQIWCHHLHSGIPGSTLAHLLNQLHD